MGKITMFPGTEDGPDAYVDGIPIISPSKVLQGADEMDLEQVLVIGWDKERMLYAASSETRVGEVLLLMHFFQHKLLAGDYNLE